MMWCVAGSYLSSLTPITIVMSSSLAGAEMMTFFAPASGVRPPVGPVVNRPVDSITTSTPRSPQGSLAGSRSARILIDLSPTRIVSPDTDTSCGKRAEHGVVLQQVRHRGDVAQVVRRDDLDATVAVRALTARQKLRPIRPNPLIPSMSAVRKRLGARHAELAARRSAMASSRRIRPAMASLVSGGSASWPSSSRLAWRCLIRSWPAMVRCSGASGAEDLQRPLHPGAGRHRGAGAAAQVGVVEVGQPVGGRPDLAAHPPLLPGQHAVVRAEPGQHRADRLAVPDHDPVHAAHVARLGVIFSRRAAPTRASAASEPGQVISSAIDRPGSVSEPWARNAPRQAASQSQDGAGHDLPGQAAHRPAVVVDQPGLAGQALAVLVTRPGSGCPCAGRSARARSARPGGRTPRCDALRSRRPPRRCPAPPRPRPGPAARCRPPANRSSVDTSALRQHGFSTGPG
jgi:hypothetical protein